jgi:hypothetical protein
MQLNFHELFELIEYHYNVLIEEMIESVIMNHLQLVVELLIL